MACPFPVPDMSIEQCNNTENTNTDFSQTNPICPFIQKE